MKFLEYNNYMAGSADTQFNAYYKLLNGGLPSRRKPNIRQEFVDISRTNTDLVDDILREVTSLRGKKRYADADKLLDIAQRILDNNKRLQNMVGEVLSDGN
jgi:hypothetical protein